MRIECRWCGERDVSEFSYLGDAAPLRPNGGPGDLPQVWAQYVYVRENPAGRHRELWYHGAGCRSWLVMTRDTRTHEIFRVEDAAEAAMDRDAQRPAHH